MGADTDHDRLIRIETKVDTLIKYFDNHIKHHWMLTIPLTLALIGVVIKLLIG
jgi:hypothetical protein